MSSGVEVVLSNEPLERTPGAVALVPVFDKERPLRGAASRVDWRLCGALSRWIASGEIDVGRGACLLLPSFGRLRCPQVLALGIGPRTKLRPRGFAEFAQEGVMRAADLGARQLVVSAEEPAIPAVGVVAAFLRGAGKALAADPSSLRLIFAVREADNAAVAHACDEVAGDLRKIGVGLEFRGVPRRRVEPTGKSPETSQNITA